MDQILLVDGVGKWIKSFLLMEGKWINSFLLMAKENERSKKRKRKRDYFFTVLPHSCFASLPDCAQPQPVLLLQHSNTCCVSLLLSFSSSQYLHHIQYQSLQKSAKPIPGMYISSQSNIVFLSAWLLCCGLSFGSLYNINEEFLQLKNDLPRKTIEDVVIKQNEMIEVIAAYQDVHDRLPTETYDPFLTASLTSKQPKKSYGEEYFDVHSDVVFVGFPASAVEAIRSKWFEPLTHTDPFLATMGSHANVVVSPGHINVRHHFHLTQISFHVADSLRDYVSELLLHPTNDGDDMHYMNAWEFEEVLDSLASTITATHTVNTGDAAKTFNIPSTDTLFVINLDMASTRGADVPYSYRNGFTTGDLRAMANEADVLRAAETALHIRRSTRVDLLTEDKTPLFTNIDKDDTLDDKYKERTRSNDVMNNQVHWRDAVSSTRDWAKSLSETIKSLAKVCGPCNQATFVVVVVIVIVVVVVMVVVVVVVETT